MTGPDISKPSGGTGGDAGYGVDAAGGVTTATPSSSVPAATPNSDDSPDSPYGSAASGNTTWTGSPYEPLPSESTDDYSASPGSDYDDTSAAPTYLSPAPIFVESAPPVGNAKRTKSRAIAGLVSAVLGSLLVAGGLYLIGEFGFRIFDVMLNGGGQPSPWDIAWTSTGAGLIFVAVLLNGWSPWATLVPGIALTAAGVWSIAWYDGADRVASTIDRLFARPEMVVWGITGWMLVLGLMLTGASGAVIIARAAGRRKPRVPR